MVIARPVIVQGNENIMINLGQTQFIPWGSTVFSEMGFVIRKEGSLYTLSNIKD